MDRLSRTDKILTGVLTPLSWLYGAAVYVRNKLFDFKLLPSERFDIPVISVGNITVGGTGKTPHVEWILENLAYDYNIAVLSRGYMRSTEGFVLATSRSSAHTIGDEPFQIYRKFKGVCKVAVCENRREGIRKLISMFPDVNLIVLDDALQHRYVDPKVSIMLMNWSRPIYKDSLLPLGTLRESVAAVNRADVVVVTKVPDDVKPLNLMLVKNELNLLAYQKLLFTRYRYNMPVAVFEESARYALRLDRLDEADMAMVLTGIASPRGLVRYLDKYLFRMTVRHFPDHHNFSRKELEKIAKDFEEMNGSHKVIITTEKDAVRLAENPYFPETLKPFIYYIPISVESVRINNNESPRELLVNAINSRD